MTTPTTNAPYGALVWAPSFTWAVGSIFISPFNREYRQVTTGYTSGTTYGSTDTQNSTLYDPSQILPALSRIGVPAYAAGNAPGTIIATLKDATNKTAAASSATDITGCIYNLVADGVSSYNVAFGGVLQADTASIFGYIWVVVDGVGINEIVPITVSITGFRIPGSRNVNLGVLTAGTHVVKLQVANASGSGIITAQGANNDPTWMQISRAA